MGSGKTHLISARRATFLHLKFDCGSVEERKFREKIGSWVRGNRCNGVCKRLSLRSQAMKLGTLTARMIRDPQRDTTEVDHIYLEIVTIHDRDFQKYSIDNSVHLVPVDGVNEHPRLLVGTSSPGW